MKEQTKAVHLLTNLLGIYSPSGKEEEIGNFLAQEMTKLGFQVGRDAIGNVIGVVGEGEPTIFLCGHMDTVEGYLPLRVEEGKIYARGAVDAKGPLAAMVMAAAQVAKEPAFKGKGKVLVASVVEEEATSRGVRYMITQGIQADYAIFGEPSGADNVTIGYKGQIQLKVICKTRTGHSSSPWLYDNALDKAYELWVKIRNSYLPLEKVESPFYAITACLTKLAGGNATSVIPFEAEMFIDIRVPPQFTTSQVYKQTRKVITQFQTENPEVTVKATVMDTVEPFEVKKSSPLVHALSSSIRKALGKPATLLRKTGTGDMNILGHAMNMPIVTYGPGDSRLDHTTDEHIVIENYLNAIEIYKATLLKLSELYHRNANLNSGHEHA
ncbi:MAG: M20/M25/M40 family metallo-hydrolase [Candidatus Bathyarchaeota archaeon]|nr:M20/M25/M40 family metallo-hydrolase [Candidatus Bathyarchaeota archaeon]